MIKQYRSISVDEKRQQLEALGEEWPIGSDGLLKLWNADKTKPKGGNWRLRSIKRKSDVNYNNNHPERWKRMRDNLDKIDASRIRLSIGGLIFSYRVPPEKMEELKIQIMDYKEKMQEEYSEMSNSLESK